MNIGVGRFEPSLLAPSNDNKPKEGKFVRLLSNTVRRASRLFGGPP